jgi:hypothetical protein
VDWRLLPTLSFLYLMCSLDKSNAGNAKLFGFLTDVGMTSTQFNLALMYFFFTYGLCEPVSNVALRRLGPKIWFPIIVTLWGVITTLTCLVQNYGSYIAIRLVLGVTEAGLYPGSYFILSMWYTPKELATRCVTGASPLQTTHQTLILTRVQNGHLLRCQHGGWCLWRRHRVRRRQPGRRPRVAGLEVALPDRGPDHHRCWAVLLDLPAVSTHPPSPPPLMMRRMLDEQAD